MEWNAYLQLPMGRAFLIVERMVLVVFENGLRSYSIAFT